MPPELRPQDAPASAPIGHRGTRAAVLRRLKQDGVATVADLASALECSVNAVRHHLKELETDGVVSHDRALHGVGAPIHAFRLTPRGHALFPDQSAGAVALLLDHMIASQVREELVEVLRRHYASLGARICASVGTASDVDRGEQIARALDAEGFMATWDEQGDVGTLSQHNCPHRVVAERFPEICAIEEAFLAEAFGANVTRQSRITAGCGSCTYQITASTPAEEGTR